MGEVYRARDAKLGRDVALKILPPLVSGDPDRVARFEREARTLAALNHPGIAHIYDAGQDGEHAYLAMELVEGDDLSAIIARGPMSLSDALPIARQLADAVETAHDQGIIHRDLKPQNIKIKADGTVKVLDFGLAKALAPDTGSGTSGSQNSPTLTARATQMGMIIGTAAYMAPEQARGRAVDRRADIWAFGVVLYEMLAGRRAFDGDDVSITLASILKEDVKWNALPADLPASIGRLLRRCLEKDPKRRLSSIGDARLELDDSTAPAEPSTPGAPRSGLSKHERWMWAALAGAAVIAAAVFAWRLASIRQTDPAVARFSVFPPAGSQFTGLAPRISISPDGRFLVFAAIAPGGADQLWLRKIDSTEIAPVPGTESGPTGLVPQSPFWSPDGRHLGFFVNSDVAAAQGESRLRVVDMLGGGVRPVCALPSNNPGGTWNAAGVILVSSQGTPGVQRVASGGGALTPVTTLDPAREEIAHLWPQFLPDGRHFIYSAVTKDRSKWAIVAGSIDSGERRQVVQAEYARFAAPNLLLYVKEQNLLAQYMDIGTRELTGEPFVIASGVALMSTNGRAAFAVSDTGVLVYGINPEAAQKSGFPERQLTWMDRTGKSLGAVGTPTTAMRFRLSPDATQVALIEPMAVRPGLGGGSLWIVNIGRNVRAPLAPASVATVSPTWSGDSARLTFGSTTENQRTALTERAANGATAAKPLYQQADYNLVPLDESADGKLLVFTGGRDNRRSLHILSRPDGKATTYLSGEFDYPQASLSTDGKWLAYVSNESGTYQVVVQSFPDPSKGKWPISTAGGQHPRWRRDGRELFYVDDEDRLIAVPVTTSPQFMPGRATTLFPLPGRSGLVRAALGAAYLYDASPDGQRFLVSIPKGASQVIPLTVTTNWTSLLKKPEAPAR
jgi:Tol biopolymer transport system component